MLLLQTMGVDVTEDLQEVKSQQVSLFASEASKMIFQSRVCSVEQGETCSRFFFQKVHRESSVLSSLKEEVGLIMPSQFDILRISKSFYARLYDTKPTDYDRGQERLGGWGVDSCLISLDREKAFDRILHTYMRDALSNLGFGDEPFAEFIGKDASLRGVTIPGSRGLQVKAFLYVDDVAVSCSDLLSPRRHVSICDQFELASGAKVNRGKNSLRVLGIWFRGAGAWTKTWEERVIKVRQKLGKWEHRTLSFAGKNLVI
eukprot:g35817.t1